MHPQATVRALTLGPRFHFFGYYDKCPWDVSRRYVLAMESDFMDHRPDADDLARIGVIDTASGNQFELIAETSSLDPRRTHIRIGSIQDGGDWQIYETDGLES